MFLSRKFFKRSSLEVHISRQVKEIITIIYIIFLKQERLETLKGWKENAKTIPKSQGVREDKGSERAAPNGFFWKR